MITRRPRGAGHKNYPDDSRSLTSEGVLLARYGLYGDAIQQFLAAQQSAPNSDDIVTTSPMPIFAKGFTAMLWMRPSGYRTEVNRMTPFSPCSATFIYLREGQRAQDLFQRAINQNPDNDQGYLSLALLKLRQNNIPAAKQILMQGQAGFRDQERSFGDLV